MVPVALASALGATLGIAAIFAWNPWNLSRPEGEARPAEAVVETPVAEAVAPEAEAEPEVEESPAAVEEREPPPPDTVAPQSAPVVAKAPPPTPDPAPVPKKETPPSPPKEAVRAEAKAPPSRAEPAPPPPTEPAPPEIGTMVLSSRLPDVEVVIDREKRETLSPLSPRRLELSAGKKRITFRHIESGLDCSVSVDLAPDQRVALLLDSQGVFALSGLERKPVPCR